VGRLFEFDKAGSKGYGCLIWPLKYHQRRNERMYLNILILVFCVAVIAMGVFAVLQMVRSSKKGGPKK
jgi:hypothetical protein